MNLWSYELLTAVIMYSIVDSNINVIFLSLRPFDPKKNVSTIVTSFRLNITFDVTN